MGVTVSNLLQGPATMYAATFGATEPANITTAPATPWRDLGATQDGVMLSVELTFAELAADQVLDIPGQTPTKRVAKVKTNLAEPTLANWALALNELDAAVASNQLDVSNGVGQFVTNYAAILFDGMAPGGKKRRVIVRRALQIGNPESAHKKDGQTLIPVEFAGHFVSSSIRPFVIIDQP